MNANASAPFIKPGPYYVSMTDKCMSGWGPAKGLISKLVIECPTYEEAEAIEQAAKDRSEMTRIEITKGKPYFRPGRYLVSWKKFEQMGGPWLRFVRESAAS